MWSIIKNFDEEDNLFNSLLDSNSIEENMFPLEFNFEKHSMTTDITEKDGKYTISANLAGFNKNDIKIKLDDVYLDVSANKEEKEEDENRIIRESKSSVKRRFYVGKGFSEEDFDAKFKNGILTIVYSEKTDEEKEKNEKRVEIK